jgi:hypothetical protein
MREFLTQVNLGHRQLIPRTNDVALLVPENPRAKKRSPRLTQNVSGIVHATMFNLGFGRN